MAEIENMAGPAGGAAENLCHATFDVFRRREQRDRIEVALHGDVVTDSGPAFVEIDAPVETDHVAAGGANMF